MQTRFCYQKRENPISTKRDILKKNEISVLNCEISPLNETAKQKEHQKEFLKRRRLNFFPNF